MRVKVSAVIISHTSNRESRWSPYQGQNPLWSSPPSWIWPRPVSGVTTVLSLTGVLRTLQGQCVAIDSTLFGSLSFYRNAITHKCYIYVTTYQLLFFHSTLCLGGLAASSPHGSSLFLLTAVEHSTYSHILFFRSLVSGYPGCFQFFEITSSANDHGDGDNVSMVKQPNIHQKSVKSWNIFRRWDFWGITELTSSVPLQAWGFPNFPNQGRYRWGPEVGLSPVLPSEDLNALNLPRS